MSNEDTVTQLIQTITAFHKELLVADFLRDLNFDRQRFQIELRRISQESSERSISFSEHPNWSDVAQIGSRVLASEYLLALAMTNCKGDSLLGG
ncbi:MAG: hypothetical protein RTU30_11655 [Candidatus Thorarchaeota archaeon]